MFRSTGSQHSEAWTSRQLELQEVSAEGGHFHGMDKVQLEDRTLSEESSLWSHTSAVSLEATRQDFLFAYYGVKRKQRTTLIRCCTVLLILALLIAVACGVLRALSFNARRQPQAIESEVFVMEDFYSMGCFPLLGNDAPVTTGSDEFMIRDTACMDPKKHELHGQIRCRSGLPFYRFSTGKVIPWRWCAKICLLKGLDISGVVDAIECRCGASERNLQVWAKDVKPREDLHFDPNSVLGNVTAPSCRIVAAQYLGALPIEAWRSDVTEADLTYIRSIVSSSLVTSLERRSAEKAPADTVLAMSTSNDWPKVAENRSCYPGPCSSGWPWPIWTVYQSGIPFAYDSTVEPSTKASVQQAIRRLQEMTCVKFTEVSLSFALTYKIVITEKYEGPCFANPMGYPGFIFGDSEVNLASCGQLVGVILHELGHALGMSHEQARKDRDDYIKINWLHIPEDWVSQYETSSSSYLGSKNAGFVPYDYGSIMHYSAGPALQSLPDGRHDGSMGQRNDFSPLDVVQLRDMYQCDVVGRKPCVDNNDAVRPIFQVGDGGASCPLLKDYCSHDQYGETISSFCAQTCDRCPTPAPEDWEGAAGCEDTDEAVCRLLDDFCPGKVAGLEQYMSMRCRKRCCLRQFCNSSSCYPPDEKDAEVVPVVDKNSSSVAMDVTFDCPRFESERLLQQRLQLRFSSMLGAGVTVKLLKAPSCLKGCTQGEARVEQLCCKDCILTCSELRLKWVHLSPKDLSAYTGRLQIVVQSKKVLDIPLTWEDLVAYSKQNRHLKYIAALLCAVGFLCVVIFFAFIIWWRRAKQDDQGEKDEDIEYDVVVKAGEEDPTKEHEAHLVEMSQQKLSDFLHHHEEATEGILPRNWCWRHRDILLAFMALLALASAGLLIYVDVAEPSATDVKVFAPSAPSNLAPLFRQLGCFASNLPPLSTGPVDLYDKSCMRTGETCGGLPFFRLKLSDGRACAEFCLSKGLDLSGILDGVQCRCGASASHPIWSGIDRPDLHWTASEVPSNSPACRIDLTKLSGPPGDVAEALQQNNLMEQDLMYVSSVVRGLPVEPPKPPPGSPLNSVKEKVIPFSFIEPLSNETKDAALLAMDMIARSTCIRFEEAPGDSKLQIHSDHLCAASKVGWSEGVDLDLGWCSTSFHVGQILHELGHVLGLINEEQRSDRDSFVKSETQMVPYVAAPMVPYDFSSVMHGPATSLPVLNSDLGVHDAQLGQRSGLSALDVLKLREIYHCGPPGDDIKMGICTQLMRHCKGGPPAPLGAWMSEHCSQTCEPPAQQWVGFSLGFSTPGFDLQKAEDRTMLGHGFASGIRQAVAASNTTVEVTPGGEAKVQVACGCHRTEGRACRSCSTLEALLRRSSAATLQRWLSLGGFAQLEVQHVSVEGQGFLMWVLEDGGVQIGICMVGIFCGVLVVVQVALYIWLTRKIQVEADMDD